MTLLAIINLACAVVNIKNARLAFRNKQPHLGYMAIGIMVGCLIGGSYALAKVFS